MRRVAITGLGIISSIGTSAKAVTEALRAGKSGIVFADDYAERGFRSQVKGAIDFNIVEAIDKRILRFMGPGSAYAYAAMEQAIADAGLTPEQVSHVDSGLIAGSGGPSTSALFTAHQTVLEKGAPKRIGPFAVPKCMSSTVSANLSTAFKIKGVNFSITSACSTSLHCIGMAAQQIMLGAQKIMFAGGGEELDWSLS
ncbi:MAG: beta-ketoacyl synthase N-terminal-like domain-containing protein, partial [Pseudomonadota bacterium]